MSWLFVCLLFIYTNINLKKINSICLHNHVRRKLSSDEFRDWIYICIILLGNFGVSQIIVSKRSRVRSDYRKSLVCLLLIFNAADRTFLRTLKIENINEEYWTKIFKSLPRWSITLAHFSSRTSQTDEIILDQTMDAVVSTLIIEVNCQCRFDYLRIKFSIYLNNNSY